jgi:hypothetical protein
MESDYGMVSNLLRIIGYLICIFGVIGGFMSNSGFEYSFITILSSLVGGLLLIGFAELIDTVKRIEWKVSGGSLSENDVYKIINEAVDYKVNSQSIELSEPNESPLLEIDGEHYIRVIVLKKYIKKEDRKLTFQLPDKEPRTFSLQQYQKGTALFENHGAIFVNLSALDINWLERDGSVWIELK